MVIYAARNPNPKFILVLVAILFLGMVIYAARNPNPKFILVLVAILFFGKVSSPIVF